MHVKLINGDFFCAVPIARAVPPNDRSNVIRCNLHVHQAVEVFDDWGRTVDRFIYCDWHGGVAKGEVKAYAQYFNQQG
jgi:hypothetical protein